MNLPPPGDSSQTPAPSTPPSTPSSAPSSALLGAPRLKITDFRATQVRCPECHRLTSVAARGSGHDASAICPHCGTPLPVPRPPTDWARLARYLLLHWLALAAVVFCVGLVAAWLIIWLLR